VNDQTEQFSKQSSQSTAFGISVRGWLAVVLVITVCVTHLVVSIATAIDALKTGQFDKLGSLTVVGEPLYSMSVAALGFYFGNQKSKNT
jgi:hypothetical protein